MAKPKIPNQKAKYKLLGKRLNKYVALVQSVFDGLAKDVSKLVGRTDYDGEKPFEFTDFPELKKGLDDLRTGYVRDIHALIYAGTTDEWRRSNLCQDAIADKASKFYGVDFHEKDNGFVYNTNPDALKAFQERTTKGMNLSQRLWNQSDDVKKQLEDTISVAVEKGWSAVTLSKRVSQYLNDFPSMQKDYGEKYGHASKAKDCQKASIRLARSEINMAYRVAEQKRWRDMDFIIGYEIKTNISKTHKEDICDKLAGKYPKWFVWKGWHPNCMCFEIPLFKTEDEFWDEEKVKRFIESGGKEDTPEASEITSVPKNFEDWVSDNKDKIIRAEGRGTLPYFIQDNKDVVSEIINKKVAVVVPKQDRKASRNVELIQRKANNRDYLQWLDETYWNYLARVRKWGRIMGVDTSDVELMLETVDFNDYHNNSRQEFHKLILDKLDEINEKMTKWDDALEGLRDVRNQGKYVVDMERVDKFVEAHEYGRGKVFDDEMRAINEFTNQMVEESRKGGEGATLRPSGKNIKIIEVNPKSSVDVQFKTIIKIAEKYPDEAYYRSILGQYKAYKQAFGSDNDLPEGAKKAIIDNYNDYMKREDPLFKLQSNTAYYWNELLNSKEIYKIPKEWRARFSELIAEINKYNPSKNSFYKVADKIDEAYNIYRLSIDKTAQSIGLDKFSPKTPWEIPERIGRMKVENPEEWIPDRRLFDILDKHWYFYALDEREGAYCSWVEGYVNIPWYKNNRYLKDSGCFKRVFYHEYGHSFDGEQYRSGATLYSERGHFNNLMKKWEAEYHAVEDSDFTTKAYEFFDSDKHGDWYWEDTIALGDVMQAFMDEHKMTSLGGHSDSYMSVRENRCHEVFAHCSEIYFNGNEAIKHIYLELYEQMLEYYTELIDRHNNK